MEPDRVPPDADRFPPDAVEAAARVVRLIDRLEGESEEESLQLLSNLMCAAWGSILAQNQ